jgi:hypothetical protein
MVDQGFQELAPRDRSWTAAWQLLTVVEDGLRIIVSAPDSLTGANVVALVDRAKYGLKLALREVFDASAAPLPIPPPDISERDYLASARFFGTALAYYNAITAFSFWHSGRVSFSMKGHALRLKMPPEIHHLIVREAIESVTSADAAPMQALLRWLAEDFRDSPLARRLTVGAQRAGPHAVAYIRDVSLVAAVREAMPSPIPLFPTDWGWHALSALELRSLLHSLQAICLHHVITNWHSAAKLDMQGRAITTTALLITVSELTRYLKALTGIPEDKIQPFCTALSYGHGVDTPDPALQPLIAVAPGTVAVPALLTVTSGVERNFLSLIARIDKRAFDGASDVFERQMIADLEAALGSRYTVRTRFYVPNRRDVGDIDLLILDTQSRCALVCELRWMLPPGETREVENRLAVVPRKAAQAVKKSTAFRESIEACLATLKIDATGTWLVQPIVILDGFPGLSSDGVRVVTRRLFSTGLRYTTSLTGLLTWLDSDAFVPKEGVHYRLMKTSTSLGGVSIERYGVDLLPRAAELLGTPGSVFLM